MEYKRVLTIQDLSCVGQCSLTVALPIISACGIETAVLPSALLSTHTTGFEGYTFNDLTSEMQSISDHWKKIGISFDGFYTGYLGNSSQIDLVLKVMNELGKPGSLKLIDPAMAENGQLYPGLNDEYVKAMKRLCVNADIVVPNLTEACLLSETPYQDNLDKEAIIGILKKLRLLGMKTIVLTGVSFDEETTGVMVYENDDLMYYEHQKLSKGRNGTGDVFSSSLMGALMNDHSVYDSSRIAADYTLECLKSTIDDPDHWYGPRFEKALPELIKELKL
jgi:pyridoxine kinase